MELKLQNILSKQGKYTNWKIFAMLISGLLLGSIIWSIYFLYQYAYTTLNNTNAIVVLNSNLGIDALDNKSFTIAEKSIRQKNDLKEIGNKSRNIFYYGNETTSSSTKQ